MKTLLLLRHAKSSWSNPGASDHDRPLNPRGERDAPRMGEWIQARGLVPDLIVSSTAKRARETARKVAASCGYERSIELEDRLYLGSPGDYIETLGGLGDEHDRVMLVGHNPGLEELVGTLTGRSEVMPTAALAHVVCPIETWSGLRPGAGYTLVRLWRPRELA